MYGIICERPQMLSKEWLLREICESKEETIKCLDDWNSEAPNEFYYYPIKIKNIILDSDDGQIVDEILAIMNDGKTEESIDTNGNNCDYMRLNFILQKRDLK